MPASRLRAVVPAYFYPATDPGGWGRLARSASMVRLVAVNVADGPGDRPDPVYRVAVECLKQSHVDVGGYVDTGYARRGTNAVLAEMASYLDWYGIDAFFLDQVSGAPDQVGHYADLARRARALGARLVAFNHGTHPAPAYADHADLLGTFEGPWRSYVDLAVPDWVRSWSPERFFHLVYSVPLARHWDAYALAARRGAGCAFVTDHGGANPWDYLPEGLFDALRHSGQHRSTARQNGLSRLHPQ